MGRVDDQWVVSAESNDFFIKRLCVNSKDNSNLGWKTRIGDINIEVALGG